MENLDQVLRFLGQVTLFGGGAIAVSYALFKHLGRKWIDTRFSERLESFKHQQAVEIQRMKVEIESMLSGALKFQEIEFSVIPTGWEKLENAYGLARWISSPFQEYANVGALTAEELDEFLSISELLESQKQKIRGRAGSARDREFQEIINLHRNSQVKEAIKDLHQFCSAKGIFLPHALKQQFNEMLSLLWAVEGSVKLAQQLNDHSIKSAAWEKLESTAAPLMLAIEAAIEQRLHAYANTSSNP